MALTSEPAPSTAPTDYSPEEVLRALLATDFMAFVEYTFGVVRPNAVFKSNWHLEALAHKLSQVASGEVKRLIITLPPRNLKSICASVALPAWFLGHHPSERVVAVKERHAWALWIGSLCGKTGDIWTPGEDFWKR